MGKREEEEINEISIIGRGSGDNNVNGTASTRNDRINGGSEIIAATAVEIGGGNTINNRPYKRPKGIQAKKIIVM